MTDPHPVTEKLRELLGQHGFLIEPTSHALLQETLKRANAGDPAATAALPMRWDMFVKESRAMTARVLDGGPVVPSSIPTSALVAPPVENDLSVAIADALDHFIAAFEERAADGKPLSVYERDAYEKVKAHARNLRGIAEQRARQREGQGNG